MTQPAEATGILRSDIDSFMYEARERGFAKVVGQSILFASGLRFGFNLRTNPEHLRLLVARPLLNTTHESYSIALLTGDHPDAPFFMSAEATPLVTLDTTSYTADNKDPMLLTPGVGIALFTSALLSSEMADLGQDEAVYFFNRLAEHDIRY